ncbi:Histone deacetylase-like amidohydrolase [Gimesia panareensis]|uniref:Histone deacetylase-like amidohydrolase n=1 Tax=Gimesia panareensis TaxID=2527978 RepID=A0A518FI83_9PLAN|nr:histone deacetylase [Gimesia panareensis]QDV16064.1 Histone deacetylase-like amidohydrolase [Gimesia panareensis]
MALLYSDPVFLQHETGGLPENPARIVPAVRRATQVALHAHCRQRSWKEISDERLERVHAPEYVKFVREFCEQGGGFISPDTAVCPESWQVARMAAGAACDAVEQVIKGNADRAFCLIRPPGHHSARERAMGFCLFNNVAIAARLAIDELELERVMIIDWDVHHGDGTQELFWEDGQVGFLSVHRASFCQNSGFAEEIGSGAGLGTNVNLPLEYGISREDYLARFTAAAEELAEKVRPQLILISAGFDAHQADPVGSLGLESEDFARLTRVVLDLADVHAEQRVVSLLEGGYNPQALADCIEHHLLELVSN